MTGLTIGKSATGADGTTDAAVTIDSATSIAGPISVYGGAVTLNAGLTTTDTATGDIVITTSGLSGSGNIALASGRNLTVTQSGNSIYNGAISGTNASFTKAGAGDLGLGGASSYTGATTVDGGILSLAAADRLSDSTALTVNANGTFSLNGFNETVGSIAGSGLIVNGAVVRDGLVLWLDAGNTASYSGSGDTWYDLSGNGYNATLYGSPSYNAGTSLFSFTNNTQYAQIGTLPADFLGSTVSGVTVFTVANFGTANTWERVVDFGSGSPNHNIILSRYDASNRLNWEIFTGTVHAAPYENKSATNTAIINDQKMSFAGTADGSNLLIYADGTLNTTTADNALPVAIARSNNYIGKSNWSVDDTFRGDIGTVMVYDRALSATEIAKNHQLLFNRSAATLTTGGNNTSTTFSGKIENGVGTLNLVKAGNGTLTLTGDNSYAGTTTVQAGTVDVSGAGRLGTAGNYTGAIANAGVFRHSSSADQTLSGVISGTGELIQDGDGELTLSGVNTYTGTTSINAGVLKLGAAGSGANSPLGTTAGTTTVASGGALDLAGYTLATAEAITISGTGVSSSGAVYNSSNTGVTWSGATTLGAEATIKSESGGALTWSGAINGAYSLTVDTDGSSSDAAFTLSGILGGSTAPTGLSINSGSANTTLSAAATVSGNVSLTGAALAIDAALDAGTNTVTLTSSGAVTDGASGYVSAANLALLGGAVTLDHASNAIGTLAASGVSALTYTDSNALTIGTVGSTNGISATGAVSVATLTGDLTVSNNISTTNGSTSAIVLNANKNADIASAPSSAGGNILLDNGVTLTADSDTNDTGERVTLYTGSISGSTGVAALVGSGSGRFRYGSDETTTRFTNSGSTALGAGTYAIYREQPTANISSMTLTMTYGDDLPSITATGAVNGDGSNYTITSAAYSNASKLKVSGSPYTITADLAGLGYSVTGVSSGTLTVGTKALNVSGLTAANKEYDGGTSVTLSGTEALTNGGASSGDGKYLTGDTVSLTGTESGTFADKNVANGKTVTISGLSLTGTDAANYTLNATTTANITAKTVSLSASKTYDGTTDLSGDVTITTGVGSETLTYTGATASSKDVATANKYINAITLADGSNGGVASNYQLPSLSAAGASNAVTITAKALTISGLTSANKTYDGTLAATVSGTAALQAAETAGSGSTSDGKAYSGDTVSLTGTAVGTFNDKDVADATTVAFTGLSLTGADAGNYTLTPHANNTAARITRATLTATANDDAKFVSQSDPTFTASVTGFVNGETSVTATGYSAPTVARTGSDTAAGTYSDVLNASGGSAANYQFSYVAGDFTIVPSNQLLVRVANASSTYGSATQYALSSVEYYNGSAVVRLDNNSVSGSSASINASNLVSINDGASGTASFTLAPQSAVTSTANKLAVGGYQLGTSGLVSENSANFSDTLTVVGAHQVNTKGITASASNVSKVYDGTVAMNGVNLGLATLETNDVVSVNGQGAFASKNAGTGLNYSIANVSLTGTDAGNYHLTGGSSLSGNNGAITQRTLVVTYTGVDKVYDGGNSATVTASDNRIVGDVLTLTRSASFANKNVGSGKTVSVTGVSLGGTDAANYTVASTGSASAAITRLSSVTWIGGNSGNWFDPANWAGGAVPDLSNVANVVIPQGVVVSFDTTGAVSPADASGAVNIDGLGTSGSLTQTNGTLNVGTGGITLNTFTQNGGTTTNAGATTLTSYSQSGGSYSGTGNFSTGTFTQTGGTTALGGNLTVTQGFSQGSSGSVTVAGNADITDTSGGMTLGHLDVAGNLTATSTGGDISQANGTTIAVDGTTTLNAGNDDIILNGANNNFAGTVNATGNDITLVDGTGGLILGNLDASGTLNATSTGGNISQANSTTIAVDGTTTLNAGNDDIVLNGANNNFAGTVNATGNDITLNDANALTLGNVTATGMLDVTAVGDIDQTANGTISVTRNTSLNSRGGLINIRTSGNHFGAGLKRVDTRPVVTPQSPPPATMPAASDAPSLDAPSDAAGGLGGVSVSGVPAAALGAPGAGGGGDAGGSSSDASAGGGSAAGNSSGLSLDLLKQPSSLQNGLIAVSVPKGTATSGTGFSFQIPEKVTAAAPAATGISAAMPDGSPLPAWLKFEPEQQRFVSTAVPDGAFPLSVAVTVAGVQTIIVISERTHD